MFCQIKKVYLSFLIKCKWGIQEKEEQTMRKRILGTLMSAIMLVMAFGTTAFASEVEKPCDAIAYNLELTSDGVASITDEDGNPVSDSVLRSSISGYEQATMTTDPTGVIVYVDSSGIGGMGATVETSSSWNGYMSLDVFDNNGKIYCEGVAVSSNGTKYFNNWLHVSPVN